MEFIKLQVGKSNASSDGAIMIVSPGRHFKKFRLGGINYLATPIKAALPLTIEHDHPLAASVIHTGKGGYIGVHGLKTWRERYLDSDIVFDNGFVQVIIDRSDESKERRFTDETNELLRHWRHSTFLFHPGLNVPEGFYYILDGHLHSVSRIMEDRHLAFLQPIWPVADGDNILFCPLDTSGNGFPGHGVVIPSRTQSQIDDIPNCGPRNDILKGLRIAIQDNFHIRGIKTTMGNRAFSETWPVQTQSSDVVVRLIRAGANIVGKTHISPFGMKEHPSQCTDFKAPINPRGDRCLTAGDGSVGSAVAVAAYDWIDLAIGSDSFGGIRIPALQTGVFGYRPSTGRISGEGLVKTWQKMDMYTPEEENPEMDTPGWLGRNLLQFPDILDALCVDDPEEKRDRSESVEILYPIDFFPDERLYPGQVKKMKEFLDDLAKKTGGTCREVSISDDWAKTTKETEKDLFKYLYNITNHGWIPATWLSFAAFYRQYKDIHMASPLVTRAVEWTWSQPPKDQWSVANFIALESRLKIFKEWFISYYGLHSTSEEHPRTIFALHIAPVEPHYRTEIPAHPPKERPGLHSVHLSPILGAPELAVPITQIAYESPNSKKTEQLPFVVSLMGAPDSDKELLKWTINALEKSGRATQVKTGRTAF